MKTTRAAHYFNENEEEIKKQKYTEDGYFLTGDIGEITEYPDQNGEVQKILKIIDRKSNIIKQSQGFFSTNSHFFLTNKKF